MAIPYLPLTSLYSSVLHVYPIPPVIFSAVVFGVVLAVPGTDGIILVDDAGIPDVADVAPLIVNQQRSMLKAAFYQRSIIPQIL